MAKKTPKPTITLDIDTWTLVSVISRLGPQVLLHEDEAPEEAAWRQQREHEARKGDVTALADLITFSPYYLAWPWTVATIYALRSAYAQVRTTDEREKCKAALDCLTKAFRGQDLTGIRNQTPARDVATLYGLLLPLYQTASSGGKLNAYSVDMPRELSCYFTGKNKGITRNQPPLRTGKVTIWSEFTFTIPAVDLEWLSNGEDPSNVALARVKALLGIGKKRDDRDDLDWITRLVRKGRRTD